MLEAVLDALPMHAAILDSSGKILCTNRPWREFAVENGGSTDLCLGLGNYREACVRAGAHGAKDAEAIVAAMDSILRGERNRFELEYPCHSPIVQRWFLLRIAPVRVDHTSYLLVTHELLTDRRPARLAIEMERAKLRTLLETATDGLHVLDESGRLIFFSDSFADMLGYPKHEMHGLSIARWCDDDDAGPICSTLAAVSGPAGILTTRYRARDGRLLDVELSHRKVLLDDVVYLYCAARDVSERVAQTRQTAEYLEEVKRVNRELEDFVAAASHDLRAPLRAVSCLSEWILSDDPSLRSETRERLAEIQDRATRMRWLLDDILDYARAGTHSALIGEETTAHRLVHDVTSTLMVPPSFEIDVAPELAEVVVTRAPLTQVLHNIIGNAINHHDRDRGSVRVKVEDIGAFWRFSVADDGPGIPDEHRERIFEMFTSLKSKDGKPGSGMGLAIVRKLAHRIGGGCGVLPSVGRGAEFWFDWPKFRKGLIDAQ